MGPILRLYTTNRRFWSTLETYWFKAWIQWNFFAIQLKKFLAYSEAKISLWPCYIRQTPKCAQISNGNLKNESHQLFRFSSGLKYEHWKVKFFETFLFLLKRGIFWENQNNSGRVKRVARIRPSKRQTLLVQSQFVYACFESVVR